MSKQPDNPGIKEQVDKRADNLLDRVKASEWSWLWIVLALFAAWAVGRFHFNIMLFMSEVVFWGL